MAEFTHYFDSGVLVKIYHLEPGSPEASKRVQGAGRVPLPFVAEIEVKNALRVLRGRNRLTKEQLDHSLSLMDQDFREGRLVRVSPEPAEVAATAELLSLSHAPTTLCRTLDLLHVAMAKTLAISNFHTGDKRQALLARKAGLKLKFLNPIPK